MNKWNLKGKIIFPSPRATVLYASLSLYRSQTSSKHILTIQPKQDLHNLTFKSRFFAACAVKNIDRNKKSYEDVTIDSSNQTLGDDDLLMAVKEMRSKVQLLQFTEWDSKNRFPFGSFCLNDWVCEIWASFWSDETKKIFAHF